METEGEAAASCLSGEEFINVPPLENHYQAAAQQQPVGCFHTDKGYFQNPTRHTEKCQHVKNCTVFLVINI